jgi:hypothetical protein
MFIPATSPVMDFELFVVTTKHYHIGAKRNANISQRLVTRMTPTPLPYTPTGYWLEPQTALLGPKAWCEYYIKLLNINSV